MGLFGRNNAPASNKNYSGKTISAFTIDTSMYNWRNDSIVERLVVDGFTCRYYQKNNSKNLTENDFIVMINISSDFQKYCGMIINILENGIEQGDFINKDRSQEVARMTGNIAVKFSDGTTENLNLFNTTRSGDGVFGIYAVLTQQCKAFNNMFG